MRVILIALFISLAKTSFLNAQEAEKYSVSELKEMLSSNDPSRKAMALERIQLSYYPAPQEFKDEIRLLLYDGDPNVRTLSAFASVNHEAALGERVDLREAIRVLRVGAAIASRTSRNEFFGRLKFSSAQRQKISSVAIVFALSEESFSRLEEFNQSFLSGLELDEEANRLLRDAIEDEGTRIKAIRVAETIGVGAKPHETRLIEILNSGQRDEVIAAHRALRKISDRPLIESPAEDFLPDLIDQLHSPDVANVQKALFDLDGLAIESQDSAAEMLRAVISLGKQKQVGLGHAGLFSTWEKAGLPALMTVIKKHNQDEPEVALTAIVFISNINAANRAAAEQVLPLIDEVKDSRVRAALLEKLGGTGRDWPEGMARVYAALDDADPVIRLGGVRGLSWSAKALPRTVVERVEALQTDPDPAVAKNAKRIYESWKQLNRPSPAERVG